LKLFALHLIRWYWRKIRPEDRMVCLFKTSCSNAVHDEIKQAGLISGILLFIRRMRSCRPGYQIKENRNTLELLTPSGEILKEEEMNPILLKEYRAMRR